MAFNHELLSTQRLRNLARRFPLPSGLVAAVMAWTRQTAPESLPVRDLALLVPDEQPVFSPDGKGTRAGSGPSSELFLPAPPSVRPGRPLRDDKSAAHLPRRTARHRSDRRRSGLRQRNISDVLTSLTASGVIKATWAGNERRFTAYRERWALLLDQADADMPSFVSWTHLLPAALQITQWLDEKAGTAESEYLIASQARSLLDRLARDLEAADINIHQRPVHGADYLPVLTETSDAILTQLGTAH